MNLDGHKLAATSIVTMAGGVVMDTTTVAVNHLQDVTQTGQIISIVVSIVSGLVSLWKLLKKKK